MPYNADVNLPGAGPIELGEEDSLPGAEHEFSILDEHGLRGPDHGGLDVRVAVAFAVAIARAMMRNEFFESKQNIVRHIGIGVSLMVTPAVVWGT